VGSFAQFHGGFGTVPLTESAIGKAMLWGAVIVGSAFAWSVRALRQSDRRAPNAPGKPPAGASETRASR
jgi:hypothetical protein